MDLNHTFGGDLVASAAGDLAVASATTTGVQRCYRRLLTNPALVDGTGTTTAPGDMLAHQDYGAGLGRLIGSPQDLGTTRALIRGQMRLESAVAQSPAPVTTLSPISNGLSAYIQYTDANTSTQQVLSFDISR